MYIAIWCTQRTLLFDIVSTIVEALVIALHQFLYPFTVEWSRLRCKASGNGFFDLRCRKSGLQGGWSNCSQPNVVMKFCVAAAVCGRALTWIFTSPAKHATSLILDRATQFLKCVATGTCVDCGALGKKSTNRTPFLSQKHCAYDLMSLSHHHQILCICIYYLSFDPYRIQYPWIWK